MTGHLRVKNPEMQLSVLRLLYRFSSTLAAIIATAGIQKYPDFPAPVSDISDYLEDLTQSIEAIGNLKTSFPEIDKIKEFLTKINTSITEIEKRYKDKRWDLVIVNSKDILDFLEDIENTLYL